MRLSRLILLAILVRVLVLVLERSAGIDAAFHPDAVYYMDRISAMDSGGVIGAFMGGDFENIFYILIGHFLREATLHLVPVSWLLILFNQACTAAILWTLGSLARTHGMRTMAPFFFFCASPYLAHLSVHPLKDTFVILIALLTFKHIDRGRWLLAALTGTVFVLSRFHLGVATCALSILWSHLRRWNLSWMGSVAVWALVAAAFYGFSAGELAGRQEVVFEGRAFYPDGFALVPAMAAVRFFLGWLFTFAVPFPFVPGNLGEVGYFLHLILFSGLAVFSLSTQPLRSLRPEGIHLVLMALFLFSFILAATPGAGPLARYRLSAELFLLIGLNLPAKGSPKTASGAASDPVL